MFDHGLATLRQGAITARLNRHIHDHRAWLHRLHHFLGHQHGGRSPGDQRSGNHDVCQCDALGDFHFLARHPAGRHSPRITAHANCRFALFVCFKRNIDKLGTQRFNLFLGRRAHI